MLGQNISKGVLFQVGKKDSGQFLKQMEAILITYLSKFKATMQLFGLCHCSFLFLFFIIRLQKKCDIGTRIFQDMLKTSYFWLVWSFIAIWRLVAKLLTLKVQDVFFWPPDICILMKSTYVFWWYHIIDSAFWLAWTNVSQCNDQWLWFHKYWCSHITLWHDQKYTVSTSIILYQTVICTY